MTKKIYTAPEAEVAFFEPEGVFANSEFGTEQVNDGGNSDGWGDWEN